jgi:hypothetical protein
MTEAVSISETSVSFYETTRRNNPECQQHTRRRDNLTSRSTTELFRFRETLRHSTSDLHGIQTRLEHILNARHGNPDAAETFSDPESETEVEDEYSYPSDRRLPPR